MPHGKRSRKRKQTAIQDWDFLEEPLDAALLDCRSRLSSDVRVKVEPGSRRKAQRASSPALEAAQLAAVRRLGELCRDAFLGAKSHHRHFEAWLWAARAESSAVDDAVPVLPSSAGPLARDLLCSSLLQAGVSEQEARSACDELGDRASSLASTRLKRARPRRPLLARSPCLAQRRLRRSRSAHLLPRR